MRHVESEGAKESPQDSAVETRSIPLALDRTALGGVLAQYVEHHAAYHGQVARRMLPAHP